METVSPPRGKVWQGQSPTRLEGMETRRVDTDKGLTNQSPTRLEGMETNLVVKRYPKLMFKSPTRLEGMET